MTLKSERHPELSFTYLVTAKHCVLKAYEKFGHLKARSNLKDRSKAVLIDLLKDAWIYPEDPGVDVAAMSVNIHPAIHAMTLPCEHFVTDESIESFGIGIGDETTTVGLFTQRYGKKLNIPILRSGIIAAMPEEPLFDDKTGAEFHAYLIEMRSIGGLSGSPVFVSIPPHRALGLNEREQDGYSVPIGLVRGHWEIEPEQDASLDDFINDGRMNMGIASVTPIQELMSLLMKNERAEKERENMERDFADGSLMIGDD